MSKLKRKLFFWFDKIQVSRSERIAISAALVFVMATFSISLILKKKLNYNQENYDAIYDEFQKRSAIIEVQNQIQEKKYAGEVIEEKQVAEAVVTKSETFQIVNINTATQAQLMSLNGIGEAYATRIIEYRELNDGFKSVEELVNVKGIGNKRLENIKPYITIE